MKHLKKGRKFSRTAEQRQAMLKNLLGSFFAKEKITTTEAKAKELKSIFESAVSQAKRSLKRSEKERISVLRTVKSGLPRNISLSALGKIAKRFSSREGGYARIIKKGSRNSDGAKMAVIEMLEEQKSAGQTNDNKQ
jgi:large subunit ribosomal protein L17